MELPEYKLDPEVRAKILEEVSSNFKPLGNEGLSEENFFELICDLPHLSGITPGMHADKIAEILSREIQESRAEFGQNWHDQIFHSSHQITLLKLEIERHEAKIREANRQLRKLRSKASTKIGRGRPERDLRLEEITKQLVAKWIQALKVELGVTTCAGLERMIDDTNQINWRNWLNGKALPTSNSFLNLMSKKINKGQHEGKILFDVPTPGSPSSFNLFNLICQDQYFEDGLIKFE